MAESPANDDRDPYYRDFAHAYDEYSRGVAGDVEFYRRLAAEAGVVVELGVGTGRIAIPTAQTGIPVVGFDREPAMLAVAREKARDAGVEALVTLREGDMRSFVLDQPVPLVTIPFRTFLHNLTTEDQLATLAACHRALVPGGRLALNVFNPDLQKMARWMGARGETLGAVRGLGGVRGTAGVRPNRADRHHLVARP